MTLRLIDPTLYPCREFLMQSIEDGAVRIVSAHDVDDDHDQEAADMPIPFLLTRKGRAEAGHD